MQAIAPVCQEGAACLARALDQMRVIVSPDGPFVFFSDIIFSCFHFSNTMQGLACDACDTVNWYGLLCEKGSFMKSLHNAPSFILK
jgi:hypothetical protein